MVMFALSLSYFWKAGLYSPRVARSAGDTLSEVGGTGAAERRTGDLAGGHDRF